MKTLRNKIEGIDGDGNGKCDKCSERHHPMRFISEAFSLRDGETAQSVLQDTRVKLECSGIRRDVTVKIISLLCPKCMGGGNWWADKP